MNPPAGRLLPSYPPGLKQLHDLAVRRPLPNDVADDVAEPEHAGRPPERAFGEGKASAELLDLRVSRDEGVKVRVHGE